MFAESLEMSLFNWFHLDLFDLIFVVTAVVFNIQVMGIYIAGKQKRFDMVRKFGAVIIFLSFPLALVFMNNLIVGQERWIMVGFGFIFLYLFVELLFDFILKIEFRSKPISHVSYIVLFYIVEFSFISIAFTIDVISGYLVSISFWALLLCLIYSLWPDSISILKHGE
jgi:UDP-N-acetylmuramyl pentapeptide phosphotransferase/UDP-N-acetylglucosamine-1-phosphate transferase